MERAGGGGKRLRGGCFHPPAMAASCFRCACAPSDRSVAAGEPRERAAAARPRGPRGGRRVRAPLHAAHARLRAGRGAAAGGAGRAQAEPGRLATARRAGGTATLRAWQVKRVPLEHLVLRIHALRLHGRSTDVCARLLEPPPADAVTRYCAFSQGGSTPLPHPRGDCAHCCRLRTICVTWLARGCSAPALPSGHGADRALGERLAADGDCCFAFACRSAVPSPSSSASARSRSDRPVRAPMLGPVRIVGSCR